MDESEEWFGAVKMAYRTDPFTAVIADRISAVAKNGAEVKAQLSEVKAGLITKHSKQRVRHAGRQIHRFMVNVDRVLRSRDRISGTRRGVRLRLRLFEEFHGSRMGGRFVETPPRYDDSVPPYGRARKIRHLSGASVSDVSARHASRSRQRRRCDAVGKPRLHKIVIGSSDHHRIKTHFPTHFGQKTYL